MFIVTAIQAENCEIIHLQSEENTYTVQGIAPHDDFICYEITAGTGQMAAIEITGKNAIFSIIGVVDAQDKYSFVTDKETYKILVGQLMRSITNQPFMLVVSIR